MNAKDWKVKLPPLASRETLRNFITTSEDADLQKAMDVASMGTIEVMQREKGLTRLDAYSLTSLTMDCRLGDPMAEAQRVHCFVPKASGSEQLALKCFHKQGVNAAKATVTHYQHVVARPAGSGDRILQFPQIVEAGRFRTQ